MDNKVLGFLAIGVILLGGGWVVRSAGLSESQLMGLIASILAVATVLRVISVRQARRTVLRRRRLYLDYWRRAPQPDSFSQAEEDSISLLGRIRGAMPFTVLLLAGTLGALYFKSMFAAMTMALASLWLAIDLMLISRRIERLLPLDRDRPPSLPPGVSPAGPRYAVVVDLAGVNRFLGPVPAAGPFWSIQETVAWLGECGFRLQGQKGTASRAALSFVEPHEILWIVESTESRPA